MLYLAIDQHRKQLTVNLRDEQGEVLLRRQVSTQWEKVKTFLNEIREQAAPEGGYVVILEVCGFNDWLLKLLAQYGCREIVLIQPTKRSRRKTDRRDANALGELLWVNRHRVLSGQRVHHLRRVQPASAQDAEARQYTSLRQHLGQQRTRTRNGIQHLLLKHNLQQACPTKGLRTIAARKWLKQLALPEVDRLEMDGLLAQWELWDDQIRVVEAKLRQQQAQHRSAKIVASMPGMSAYSSLAIGSRIGAIERFPRPGSLANYWGLVPGCRNSGDANARSGSITKEGSKQVRFLLGQLVLHVLRADARMRGWYRQVRQRRGSKIARVAVMRRMATTIWHLVKHEEPYQLNVPAGAKRRRRKDSDGRCSNRKHSAGKESTGSSSLLPTAR